MNETTLDVVQFLLPGFVMAWVFFAMTPHKKESSFERVIQALVFTAIVQSLVGLIALVAGKDFTIELNSLEVSAYQDVFPTMLAVVLGLTFSGLANSDKFHSLMRFLKVTKKTGFPSVWYQALYCTETFAVLHLKDERRIKGWVLRWPTTSSEGHFQLTHCTWLADNSEEIPLEEVESMLINSEDVQWIELLKMDQ